MSTLTIEGWSKIGEQKSIPIGEVHFLVDGPVHEALERAEERLQKTRDPEDLQKTRGLEDKVDVDLGSLELILPPGYGPLSDCYLRVYLKENNGDPRGHFHLVGHQADGKMIYTNAVLIAQLS
jgi:hypothetical protein